VLSAICTGPDGTALYWGSLRLVEAVQCRGATRGNTRTARRLVDSVADVMTNACGQLGTQQTGISRLVRDPADGCQPQIDGGGRVMALLEVDPIAKNDGAVERETWLRAVPGDELSNRVFVGPLAAGGREAVQHGRLGLFQVGKGQHPLGRLLCALFGLRHSATASFTVADSVDPVIPGALPGTYCLVDQTGASWNRIASWLCRLDSLRGG